MARPTIADTAARAGVSKGAVSFALNGRPGVSEATRDRILRIADEMRWRPHSAARALGGNSHAGAVGLILSRPTRTLGVEPFFGELVSGLQIGLADRGTALQLLIVDSVEAEMEAYQRWMASRRVDGFVVLDVMVEDPRLPLLEELGVPTMVIGGPMVSSSLHSDLGLDHLRIFPIWPWLQPNRALIAHSPSSRLTWPILSTCSDEA